MDTSGCVDKIPSALNYHKLPLKQEIERSTSGRGAKASYLTMLPEISARRSLLEPSFRYLSPGREGEKCRPLDHVEHIPFIHSDRFLIWNNFFIYTKVYQLSLPCGTHNCFDMKIAHVLSQKTQIMIPSHFLSPFFPKIHAGVHWNILLAELLFVLSFKGKDLKENKREALINTTLLWR